MADRNGVERGEAVAALERLETVVKQRNDDEVWRSFLVAQASSRENPRRREMTTQKIFLLGQRER